MKKHEVEPNLILLFVILLVFVAVAFKMYDLDDDDSISRAELLAVLHMMVGSNISEEQVSLLYHTGHTATFMNIKKIVQ